MPAATTGERRAALCAVAPMSMSVGALSRSASRIGPASASWSPDGSRLPAAWSSGSSTGCGAGRAAAAGVPAARGGRARHVPRGRVRRAGALGELTVRRCRSRASRTPIVRARRRARTGGRNAGAGGGRAGGAAIPGGTRSATARHRRPRGCREAPSGRRGEASRTTAGCAGSRTTRGGGKQPDRRQQGRRPEREQTPERRSRGTRDQELESVVMRVARYMDSPDRRAPTVRTGSVHSTGRRLSLARSASTSVRSARSGSP